jgi:hypothetical protein
VIGVGDLDEEVRAPARLALSVGTGRRLHQDSGGVGRDAEGGCERLLAHGLDNGGAQDGARLLEPTTQGAAVDGDAEPLEPILLPVERQPVAELVARNVRDERGCRVRAHQELGRHRRRHDRGRGRRLRVALLESDTCGLALEHRIGDLEPLLADRRLAQITTALALALALAASGHRAGRARGTILVAGHPAGQRIEGGQLPRELELELSRVDALGLRHHQAAARKLNLELEKLIGRAQPVALRLHIGA